MLALALLVGQFSWLVISATTRRSDRELGVG